MELIGEHCLRISKWKETIRKLVTLKQVGIKLTIDDFGKGVFVVNLFKSLPIDTLRRDQRFICHLHMYRDDTSAVNTFL
ncbi:EAL domain-containing protein [Peribacillus sp. JNUCC 23]|uniref:EAL domain-containing protein n=1 Tax=Peribacillus sp. NPDC096379 TaxID=3364393 RepID=UPI0038210111